jgi:type VI protein secretion system component VasK
MIQEKSKWHILPAILLLFVNYSVFEYFEYSTSEDVRPYESLVEVLVISGFVTVVASLWCSFCLYIVVNVVLRFAFDSGRLSTTQCLTLGALLALMYYFFP